MTDSLVIANAIELLGGGVPSTNPLCLGAEFRLAPQSIGQVNQVFFGTNLDLGGPQPTTDFVASLLLDGERPFGRRASNRTINLPIAVIAKNRLQLAAAREVLMEAIDQDQWVLTWTRDPGVGGTPLPLVFDCFRALPTSTTYDFLMEQQAYIMGMTIAFQALPYARSDKATLLSFASPAPVTQAPAAPPSPVVLDAYTKISSPQFQQSTKCVVGPFTLLWDPDFFGDFGGQQNPLQYSATFSSALNLTSMTTLQMFLGLGSRYYEYLEYRGRTTGISISITLTDSSGKTLSCNRGNLRLPVSPTAQSPVFSPVTIPIPQGVSTFNYASVASYSITITNRTSLNRFSWVTAYVDALTAYPGTQTANPVTRGSLYALYGIAGTARSPISLAFQQPPSPGTPTTITTAGTGTYTVPANTAYLKVECWGGGGPGGSSTVAGVTGGGGGAEYAREDVFACSPGDVIPYAIGAGGTPGASPNPGGSTVFGPGPSGPLFVQANGGQAAALNSIVGGTGGTGSTNSVHFNGGAGRTASGSVGGGGGGSGGSASAGLSPTGTAADVFNTVGTTPWVAPAGVTQVFVEVWGSGGSGATGNGSSHGGGGGGGEYSSGFLAVTPGNTYNIVIPAGGASVTGSGLNGNAGSSTTFTGDSGSITGHGGGAGILRASWQGGGGGSGGSGSTAPTHFNGGSGGVSNPYGGSGGSSAGSSAAGNSGSGYGGTTAAPTAGGNGGASSNGSSASNGSVPGGGGGGTTGSATSGAGGAGQVKLTYPGGAPTNNGASAVTGGGAGGAGGGSNDTGGTNGSQPGGGGGGVDQATTAQTGGSGGTGQIKITPFASAAFKNLIVHRPAFGAPKNFQPLVSVGGGSDAPDGTHEYRMPQPVTGVSADFSGTYTVILVAASLNGSSSRTVTVTVNQYEYSGGPKYSTSTLPLSFTPSQISNGMIIAGVLTLPLKALAPDNTGGYFTVTPNDTNTADRFYDCIFLDTMGQTVIINEPSSGYVTYYLDAPTPNTDLGYILGSQSGRPNAISVMDAATISGGAMAVEPADGVNQLFAYSADGVAPSIALSHFGAWFFDRFQ